MKLSLFIHSQRVLRNLKWSTGGEYETEHLFIHLLLFFVAPSIIINIYFQQNRFSF